MSEKAFLVAKLPSSEIFWIWEEAASGSEKISGQDFRGTDFSFFATPKIWDETLNGVLSTAEKDTESTPKEEHINLLGNSIALLQNHPENKVVLARKKYFSKRISLTKSLLNLSRNFPHSLVYLLHHPRFGTWLGATPELLGAYHAGLFSTMALAGTKTAERAWTEKEYREHQFVIDAVIDKIPTALVGETITVSFSNLQHLYTPISLATLDYQAAQLLPAKLHPTPAVCGTPKDWAKNYILQNEGFSRKLYTGYFGISNDKQGTFDFFVNLRSIQVFKDGILGFAGGGITYQSQADDEFLETERKLESLQSHLVFD